MIFILLTLLSFNANAQWTSLSSGTTFNLNSVFFTSEDTGFVTGGNTANSVILKTVNGGVSWTIVYSKPTNDILSTITFSNSHHGFAVGGTQSGANVPILLYTTDGGNTWNSYTSVPAQGNFSAVKFIDTSNGYITGSNLFQYGMKTNDGGNTWSNLPSVFDDFYTICFANTTDGFLSSWSGGLLATNNGGNTWTTLLSSAIGNISDIRFTTLTHGIAVGSTGTDALILKTVNSGSSWTTITSFTSGSLSNVSFPSPSRGFALGALTSGAPIIISSADSGNHWSTMTLPIVSGNINGIYFPDINVGYAVGDSGRVLKYSNTTYVRNITENTLFYSYPNPVNNICYWKVNNNYYDANAKVSLYGINGKLLDDADCQEGKIDMSNLANGMYILKFGNKNVLIEKR